eukprot:1079386-Lingulodinium_polyedra.AAC.1
MVAGSGGEVAARGLCRHERDGDERHRPRRLDAGGRALPGQEEVVRGPARAEHGRELHHRAQAEVPVAAPAHRRVSH